MGMGKVKSLAVTPLEYLCQNIMSLPPKTLMKKNPHLNEPTLEGSTLQ